MDRFFSVFCGLSFALVFTVFPGHAQNVPASLNVSGALFLPSGAAVTQSGVSFRLEIWDVNKTCLLYTEEHLGQDLTNTKGGFSLPLGQGSSATNYFTGLAPLTSQVFANSGTIAGGWANCGGGATFNPGDQRLIQVYYNLGGGYTAMTPEVPIASSAYAMIADSVQGLTPSDLIVAKNDGTHVLTQSNVNTVFTTANYARLLQLLNPTAAVSFGSQRLTDLAAPTASGDAATKGYADARLAGQTIDLVDVAPGTGNGKVLTWDATAGRWVAQAQTLSGTAGGDLTGSYPNPQIAALAVGTSEIQDNAVTPRKIRTTGIAANQLLLTNNTDGETFVYKTCANNEILKFTTGVGWECGTVAAYSAVVSVNGKSGVVNLNGADLGLGTASMRHIGIGASEVPDLDAQGKLAYSTIPLFLGDVTGAINANVVTRLQGRTLASTAPNFNEVLRWNGSHWEPAALTDNVGITALQGDVTASGTGLVSATIVNNAVTTPKLFANPGNNRLVATDNSGGGTLRAFECNLDETLRWTASGWACVSPTSLAGVIANNGNSFSSTMTLGTNDAQLLLLETNNTPRLAIGATNGFVGIGTTAPARLLEVAGPIRVQPSALPGSPSAGDLAFDSGAANTLKFYDGTAWRSINTGSGFALAGANSDITSLNALTAINGASLNIGDSATTTLNVGANSTDALTAVFGANTGASSTTLRSGTGGLSLSSTGTSASSVDLSVTGTNGGIRLAPNGTGLVTSTRPLQITPAALPGSPSAGVLAFDSGAGNALKYHDGSAWVSIGNGTVGGSGTANYLTKFNGANTIANSSLYESGGNIGVGTTAPARLLEVAGVMRVAPTALPGSPAAGDLAIDSGAGNSLKYHNGTTWVSIGNGTIGGSGTANYISKFSGTNTLANSRLAENGTGVGIGTTAPSSILHLSSNVDSSTAATLQIANTSAGNSASSGLSIWNNTGEMGYLWSGSATYMGGGGNYQNRFAISAAPSSTGLSLAAEGPGDDMQFLTGGATAAFERMRITAAGNVGIGTTSPARLLQVAGPIRVTPTALPGAPAAGDIAFDSGAANALKYHNGSTWVSVVSGSGDVMADGSVAMTGAIRSIAGSAASPGVTFSGDTDTGMFRPAADHLALGTSGIERMRIHADGFVGIGTTSPGTILEVAGEVRIGSRNTICSSGIEGAIRYNSTTKKIEFCNGTAWLSVGSGTIANIVLGSPSSTLVKSGPITYAVTYGSGTDSSTISLTGANITFGGTATTGCTVTGITGSGLTRNVVVDGCSGTGTVNISIAAGTANSTTGDPAVAAGPSGTFQVDNTGPTLPTGVSLGSVPNNVTNSPTITYAAASDVGGSTVANYQVQILKTADSSVVRAWANHTSGSDVGGMSLATNTQYSVLVRAVDALGNYGSASTAVNWTSVNTVPQLTLAPNSATTVPITHLTPGSTGTLEIFLAGTASPVGNYYSWDNYGGPQASGESGYFTYALQGDETSFSLVQVGFDWINAELRFVVNGGVNNGKYVAVGSANNSGGWAPAGCPNSKASTGTLSVTRVSSGCNRPYNSGLSYSDGSGYSPSPNATYGSAQGDFTKGGHTVTIYQSALGGGMYWGGTGLYYGRATVLTPSAVTAANGGTRPSGSIGAVLLVYP